MADPDLAPCPWCKRKVRWVADDSYGNCLVFCPGEYEGCNVSPSLQGAAADPGPTIEEWNRAR